MSYATVADLIEYLKLDEKSAVPAATQAFLTKCIARAQSWVEEDRGTVFEAAVATVHYFNPLTDVTEPGVLPNRTYGSPPYTNHYRWPGGTAGGGWFPAQGQTLILDSDLAEITQVVNGDGSVLAASAYIGLGRTGANTTPYWGIQLKSTSAVYWTYSNSPENAIAVTGYWAYSKTPPAVIVQATLELAAYLYRRRDSSWDVLGAGTMSATLARSMPWSIRQMLDSITTRNTGGPVVMG